MGIPFTMGMGFLLTMTMGKLFTMTLGIQLTISTDREVLAIRDAAQAVPLVEVRQQDGLLPVVSQGVVEAEGVVEIHGRVRRPVHDQERRPRPRSCAR